MGDTCFADPVNPEIFSDDLDFTFDDIYLPSDTDEFLNSLPIPADPASDLDSLLFSTDFDPDHSPDVDDFLNSSSPDSPDHASSHGSGNSENFGNSEEFANSENIGISGNVENSGDFGNLENLGDFGNLENFKNSGDFGSLGNFENSGDLGNLGKKGNSVKIGKSGDFGNSGVSVLPVSYVTNNVADEVVDHTKDSVSGNSGDSLSRNSYVSTESVNSVNDQKIKVEEESNNSALKRKKGSEKSEYSEENTSKYRKSNDSEGINENLGEDEKRKARLMRNRESAQLSRQRKKHYVEELEDKVRVMQSTIIDLNNKISYVMAENATLRQQANGVPPPGMYPHPPMGYPWVPCPSYMMKPQGSQVPLVPIPRLKPQTAKVKRSESKIKKVASVSFLGLFVFLFILVGLVPMVNLKFREMNESVSGRVDYLNNRASYNRQKGRILTSLKASGRDIELGNDFVSKGGQNLSEPLVASLYVPRNDKLVKIDGNLIIHSIMASERALASRKDEGRKRSEETGLAVANNNKNNNNVPSIIPLSGRSRHQYRGPVERPMAISGERDKLMSSATDGKLQQWFREGLAGPMLSSGMCTEVFQFDVSPAAGAIIPVTPVVNASSDTQNPKNITNKLIKGRNRRILHGSHIPLASSESNITENPSGIDPEKDNLRGNNYLSSMVVSVLVDPREAGDGEGDGVMGPKSLSRIFVVVLIDSVKYVTYSCMLPLIGSGAHLVTT